VDWRTCPDRIVIVAGETSDYNLEGASNMPDPKKDVWQDHHDPDAPLTEDSLWQAIADAEGLDYSEIADGDLVEWL
jgi:hypothetical protein